MDRFLRQEILKEFHQVMKGLNEKYVTAETLCEHVETQTPQWLKHHGSCFNRTRVEWTDKTGHHTSSWLYPLHEIIHMVQDGRISNLVVRLTYPLLFQ